MTWDLIIAPVVFLQDVIGKRGILALLCSLLTIPLFGLLAFTTVYPLVCTLWLGVTYSFAAVSPVNNIYSENVNLLFSCEHEGYFCLRKESVIILRESLM